MATGPIRNRHLAQMTALSPMQAAIKVAYEGGILPQYYKNDSQYIQVILNDKTKKELLI